MYFRDPEFAIYHISYIWYTLVGALVTITVAVIVSLLTKPNKPSDLNPNLLAPFVRKIVWKHGINVTIREEPVGTEGDVYFPSTLDLKNMASTKC